MKKSSLTDFQKLVADEYMVDFDQAAAYRRASAKIGRSAPKGAKQNASSLFKRPQVAAYLQLKRELLASKALVSQAEVLKDLEGFRNLSVHDFFMEDPVDLEPRLRPLSQITGFAAKFIKKIKTTRTRITQKDGSFVDRVESEIAVHDILRVEEMIGRYLGIWKDQAPPPRSSTDLVGVPDEQLERELTELKNADVIDVRNEPKRIG